MSVEENAGKRIGKRIRAVRTARGLSQTDLGNKVDLTANRIQKYENGQRTPKPELLSKIAKALEVNPFALMEPTPSNPTKAMFTLFELEQNFGVKVETLGNKLCLSIDETSELYEAMESWHEKYHRTQVELSAASSGEDKEKLEKEYKLWKWTFPQCSSDEYEKALQKLRLRRKIKELQKAYDALDDEETPGT